ncbi:MULTISPECIES: protein kinase domain-containing protein [Streptomyces]|uniref:non-specific serine/threonine protein kinase n=1 Tax=Streptomyces caniscabiei TaxID=2746961 RepID=A0ABU4MFM3_9ACTN|nr:MULTISPECIES: protein kinase [Streptomyces]MBE4734828.1 serine/threonine protein kinase [Streptomyces caniscabiei]MBE4753962.1 serine/threonine protein kinase [Streptomyces caniscabiei]MBE4767555.1 serine/threonine protein kinase [Streptomyces caniscabiei]MBE4784013.1 serine/threonine protein kinase [Streptomyces caniscabiei]MBE4791488.1 serine/threonine protein kinase [Streptomyces caniscabiei]
MAQQQRSQGPSDPEASGGGMSDAPELWGNGGLVGDGRYRMTHRLGRGGMAEVFAAEDVRLGRTVAVKLLRSDLAEDPISKARFTREAQAVAGLNHHSIVAVYDSGEDMVNGTPVPYIVMELVEGRTIRDLLINAEAPGPEQALIIVSGVLEALAYSHQHGIVHRDIKPANVIITTNGAVKVMDFGIARALHGASTTMTQTGMVMGTPQYLSPEQALGKAVDHRSDLYATGCLLYELLALRPPFIGETPLSVVYQHVQDIPVPPSETSEGSAPPELDGLVMRSLAKEPDDRFQTAEEMRGLVQYGLQMLYDQGGHTGTWNTGPVTMHEGRHTPPGGMSGTSVMPHPGESGTSQIPQPILPGYGGGGRDDGGFEGNGNRGSGRGKLWILAVLAVIAIAAGVALALNNNGDKGGGGTETTKSPTATKSEQDKDATESPSEEATEETTDDSTDPDNGGGFTPSYTQTPSFTQSPTQSEPSEEPTTDEPTTDEPTTDEPTEEPTEEPTDDSSGGGGDAGGLPGGIGGEEG